MTRKQAAFTLVELMVSTTILVLMMVILLQMTGQTANTWRYGAAKAEQFQEARKAFETMTRRISEATLNTYWDYYISPEDRQKYTDPTRTPPASYVRASELRFRVVNMQGGQYASANVYRPAQGVFFQAPIGMVDDQESNLTKLDDLLNSWGYYVEVGPTNRVPSFLASGYPERPRARLMEYRQPTEEFDLYKTLEQKIKPYQKKNKPGDVPDRDPVIGGDGRVEVQDDRWFTDPLRVDSTEPLRRVRVLAENVLALVILPRLTPADERARQELIATGNASIVDKQHVLLTPDFQYHSKQLTNYTGATYDPSKIDPELNPKNQLPPVVQIAMIAIDEASAQRLETLNPGQTDLGLPDLFTSTSGAGGKMFTDSTKLTSSSTPPVVGDLEQLEQKLVQKKLSYRIFSSNVALKGAKWSRSQVK
jgi:uncharacterized protein (TIGR02599 family)